MKTFETVNAVLDFAVEREQQAVDFYMGLSEQIANPALKKTLIGFAGVEKGHKKKLLAAKAGDLSLSGNTSGIDLKIADYLVEANPGPEMSFQDALVIAIKRENAAMQLYTDMVGLLTDPGLDELFKTLADEEARHKFSFETTYEKHFLSEN